MKGGLAIGNAFMRDDGLEDELLIDAVASAFESDPASEAEFIEQVAGESGGLSGALGGLGRLWGALTRLRGGRALPPRTPTGQTPMLPPPPTVPPGPPYDQPIPRPPKLPSGPAEFEFSEMALEDLYERDGPPSSGSAPTPRPWGSGLPPQFPPTLRSGAPAPQRTQLAQWLVGGLVPRGSPAARAMRIDPFDGFEAVLEAAIEADEIEAAAPVLAGLAVRRAVPQARQMPRESRRRLVAAVTKALRQLVARSGAAGARATPALVQSVGRIADFKGLPPNALPPAISRNAAFLASRPDLIRRLAAIAPRAGS